MSGLVHDLRFAIRMLGRSPAATAAAVLMLALGVGSATAIFSIVNSVLLKPLPWRDSGRIVRLFELDENGQRMSVALPNYVDWQAQTTTLEAVTAVAGSPSTLAGGGRSERGYAAVFHGDPLAVYGLRVAAGRTFSEDERRTGSPPVAVIAGALAKQLWDEPGRAVGETIDIGDTALTVIGVTEGAPNETIDVYAPAAILGPDDTARTAHNWNVIARVRPEARIEEAQTEMRAIGQRLYRQYPGETDAASVDVVTLLDETVGNVRPVLLALMTAGGLLILIACANVANLLLAQGVARRREIAVRQTLGASRWRLIRQFLLESVALALLAGTAGTVLAQWSFAALLQMVPGNLPRIAEIQMDAAALGFSLLVSLAAGLLFGLAPALRAPATSLAAPLKQQGRTATGGDTAWRRAFVVGEFALSLAMLICAGLVAKSFLRLLQVDPGFGTERVVLAETVLPETAYRDDPAMNAFWQQMLARLEASPEVEYAGLTNRAPLDGFRANGTFEFLDEPGREGYAWYGIATTGYFQALNVPLVRGRLFEESDSLNAPHVAVINETAASKFWPGEDPIGKRIQWAGMDSYDPHPIIVIGVVGDVRHRSLKEGADPEINMHFFQRPRRARDTDLLVKARSDAARLPEMLRSEFQSADADLPVRFQRMSSVVDAVLLQPRFQMRLFGFFAACAVFLSAVGLFSAVAYMVTRQTREIGIRLALGATPRSVRRQVLRNGMGMTLAGIVLGVFLALAAGRFIAAFLFGVEQGDVAVVGGAALLLAMTALLACYAPARRASRVDPMQALRYE